jgi:hypothetical protein
MATRYIYAVAVLEVAPGVLLLINRYVPLGLTRLGSAIVNIVFFHILMEPSGLPLAGILTILWLLTAWWARSAFAGLFQRRVQDRGRRKPAGLPVSTIE